MQLRPLFSLLGSPVRHGSRPLALAVSTLALLGAVPPVDRDALGDAAVTVVARNLRNDHGVVRACLTNQADRFPTCDDPERSFKMVRQASGTVTLVFHHVPPGRYAVALLHDENGNGKADRAAMMIPKEGFGFSRDAKVRFGPPRFGAAAFDVARGTGVSAVR